jgi:peptidoglycan hydrolase-like protein with peptidoglycan-binding domain
VRRLIRRFFLGTASVLALGVAGNIASTSLNGVAEAGNTAPAAAMPAAVGISRGAPAGDPLRTNDIRWAQVELRYRGLYQGSLDGILGPETKRALTQFQLINGLGRTVSLDTQTWEALTGNSPIVEGSSDHTEFRGDVRKIEFCPKRVMLVEVDISEEVC